MKYQGCLLAVKDMATSKNFYENVLAQKVVMDLGVHVSFEGFSLQQGFDEVIGISANSVKSKEHNFQLYFELDDLDAVFEKMKSIPELQWVHEIKEYAWGQRDFRVYDPDFHIIEIAESMESVVKRFLRQGMSVEEVSKKTMYPLDMLKQLIN
ncbi:MAG: VOC family protein [Clostridiales bacterium]|nr:VOC family protein [Clostridiales bacterium]